MAAIQFDTRLGELGGQRLLKRGVGDDRDEDGGPGRACGALRFEWEQGREGWWRRRALVQHVTLERVMRRKNDPTKPAVL